MKIIHPITGERYTLLSGQGKSLLKKYIHAYQNGGVAILAKVLKDRTNALLQTELWNNLYKTDKERRRRKKIKLGK